MKKRIFYLLRLLYESTYDEEHSLDTYAILDYLDSVGCSANRKTLKSDLDLLAEMGMDIIKKEGSPNRYYWGERTFQVPEIKLLIDAVSSSRFITAKKSEELIQKLCTLMSKEQAATMSRHLFATDRIKPNNESIYYIVDSITDAINDEKQISFQYYEYTGEKKKILRNDGELYTISPYVLYWSDDFYYVVGYSEKREKVAAFRVDRLHQTEIIDKQALPKPAEFDVTDYSKKIFEMYNGKETTVKIQCEDELMKYVVDRFGEEVKTKKKSKTTFVAEVPVALSPTFYGWVFQFAGKMKIISPEQAKEEYTAMIKSAL